MVYKTGYSDVEQIIICVFSFHRKIQQNTIAAIISKKRGDDDDLSVSTEAIRQKLSRLREKKLDVAAVRAMQRDTGYTDDDLRALLDESDQQALRWELGPRRLVID